MAKKEKETPEVKEEKEILEVKEEKVVKAKKDKTPLRVAFKNTKALRIAVEKCCEANSITLEEIMKDVGVDKIEKKRLNDEKRSAVIEKNRIMIEKKAAKLCKDNGISNYQPRKK